MPAADIAKLKLIEKRLLWLACWTVHNANHLREKTDGVKVGGHQASSASMISMHHGALFLTRCVRRTASPSNRTPRQYFTRSSISWATRRARS
jgi:pyruvate dehydrogenase complex dehydrogenase (E1) component